MDAERSGAVRVAVGRASDFIGTNLTNSLLAPRFWQRLLAGKSLECPGDPDLPHSYNCADDVAQGLATLGEHDEAFGQIWHLPATTSESTRALYERIARAFDPQGPARVARVPQWFWHAAGLFSPMMREMAEMTYQWRVPYVIDDSRFRAAFHEHATPIEQVVNECVAWARDTYRRAA
jgi:nucleoside-diphosphate-sugar epimerase